MKIRKAANALTAAEWENFICAFKNLREGLFKGVARPTMDDFADEHAAAFKERTTAGTSTLMARSEDTGG